MDANEDASAGNLVIRAENSQTPGLGGGAKWIRTLGPARFARSGGFPAVSVLAGEPIGITAADQPFSR